jgi:hypothetical protein
LKFFILTVITKPYCVWNMWRAERFLAQLSFRNACKDTQFLCVNNLFSYFPLKLVRSDIRGLYWRALPSNKPRWKQTPFCIWQKLPKIVVFSWICGITRNIEHFSPYQRFVVLLDATIIIWKKGKYNFLITFPDAIKEYKCIRACGRQNADGSEWLPTSKYI